MFINSNQQLAIKLQQVIGVIEEGAGKQIDDLQEEDLIGLCGDASLATRMYALGFWVLEMKLTYSKELQQIILTPEVDEWVKKTSEFIQSSVTSFESIPCLEADDLNIGPANSSR